MSAANFQTISAGRRDLPDALARFRQDDGVRAIVLTDLASSAARTPVIAAVGGTTGGDACLLALACSFAVATGAARFALPLDYADRDFALAFARQLIVASQLGSPPFQKLSAGEEVTAQEALSVGLVTQVVADRDDLIEVCQSLARQVGEHAPLALRSAAEAVTRGLRLPLEEALRGESRLFARCFSTEDAREGVRAFYEKRAPRFGGR
jgi:enoyl-CoA hydratase/carnithine racemase